MSVVAHLIARLQRPFMIYGIKDLPSGEFRKYTRISSSATILHRERLRIGPHVWIGHHSVLDASGGLSIGEGVQIGVGVCIYTHGSQNSIRLLGAEYVNIPEEERAGYTRTSVTIGRFTFVGSGAIILPGATIGDGVIIGPNAIVSGIVPDRTILTMPPSRAVGDTLTFDLEFARKEGIPQGYYDPSLLRENLSNPIDEIER